jgi:hypothetical protein
MKKLIIICVLASYFVSCDPYCDSKITLKNNVSKVKIENINFGDYQISGALIPSETSKPKIVSDKKSAFPKTGYISFYMTSNGNRVLLRTKEIFILDADKNLDVVINNDTEVLAP